jgi:hydrogenase expression/formation protein HypE
MGDLGDRITLAHGSGGLLMHRLIAGIFRSRFANQALEQGDDSAELPAPDSGRRLAFTTDSYTVKPIFFPGGDIGRLAVCGTVNDLAAKGARPLWMSASFIIGEGFPVSDLERVADSMAGAAAESGVTIVTGDTKVVERQACDGLFINTSGIGAIDGGVAVSGSAIRPGDDIIISGPVGDHGAAVMNARLGLGLTGRIASDAAPLWPLAEAMLRAGGVRAMRDPTRGGLATTLNELAGQSRVRLEIEERAVPVRNEVRAASEMLGLDPLYLACEGRLAAAVAPERSAAVLGEILKTPLGAGAAVIGRAEEGPGDVVLRTAIGTRRPLLMLEGEHLPRIC